MNLKEVGSLRIPAPSDHIWPVKATFAQGVHDGSKAAGTAAQFLVNAPSRPVDGEDGWKGLGAPLEGGPYLALRSPSWLGNAHG